MNDEEYERLLQLGKKMKLKGKTKTKRPSRV